MKLNDSIGELIGIVAWYGLYVIWSWEEYFDIAPNIIQRFAHVRLRHMPSWAVDCLLEFDEE